jgi:cytochrome c553
MNILSRALVMASVAVAASAPLLATAGDVKAGERNAAMCIGCHGIPGYQASFPEVHRVPMIAGQNAKYIVASLQAYKKGDRKHPTMIAIARGLTDTEMADLAAFYEQQAGVAAMPAQPSAAPSAKVAELLKKANCISCHGENFSKAIDPSYPKIAGQHADYLYVALKAYQVDGNPVRGRNNAIMSGMARQYTPAELKAMANYIGSLQGELRTVPQRPLR